MKDFDKERRASHAAREKEMADRSFKLGGETFTYRPFVSYTVLQSIAASGEQEGVDLIQSLESAVVALLEDGQEDRFLAVARSQKDPLTFADLNDLCTWLTEAQVGRPMQAPSPSTDGDAKTSTSSTEDSSSKLAEASAA